MEYPLTFINLSWAEIGIFENTAFPLASLRKEDEPIEKAVERYVIGYMAFWNIAFIKKGMIYPSLQDDFIRKRGQDKIRQYVERHPPIEPLPKFYIVFLNQPQIGCDADGFSDVFCM